MGGLQEACTRCNVSLTAPEVPMPCRMREGSGGSSSLVGGERKREKVSPGEKREPKKRVRGREARKGTIK